MLEILFPVSGTFCKLSTLVNLDPYLVLMLI